MNLANLTSRGIIEGRIIFDCAFDTISGIYYPGGKLKILIAENNLHFGYCGNTLLKEINPGYHSEFDFRIGKFLFSKASLEIPINNSLFGLARPMGYLRLNARVIGLK